jgi:4'-phosphopantetheinyl transferase EntD
MLASIVGSEMQSVRGPEGQGRDTALFASLLPAPAIAVQAGPSDWDARLLPEEEPMVARAIERRRREVAAGRSCARRALALLGAPPTALPADGDRVPRWPSGVAGSITHTRGFCAAAVAWQRDLRALGIDAERPIDTERADVMRLVATPGEAAWLARLDEEHRAAGAGLVFSAKEALYKCQFPLTREMLEFSDVELSLDGCDLVASPVGELTAVFRPGTRARDLPPLQARYALGSDLVATAAFLPT